MTTFRCNAGLTSRLMSAAVTFIGTRSRVTLPCYMLAADCKGVENGVRQTLRSYYATGVGENHAKILV